MRLNIKNIEYMIAKNIKAEEQSGEVKTKTYNVNRNNSKSKSAKYFG